MIDRLLALQERGRPLINGGRAAASHILGDEPLKKEIDALYQYYFGRVVTGCKNCYADALVELCSLKKATAMNKTDLFVVRRGKVLKDTRTNDARLNLVRGNETEELALYHLYTNPNSRQFFERLPDNTKLETMLAEYGEKFEANRNAKYGNASGIAAADKVVNDAKDKAAAIETEAAKLKEDAEAIYAEAKVEATKLKEAAEVEIAERMKRVEMDTAKLLDDAKAEADKIVKEADARAAEIVETAKNTATPKAKTVKGDPIME